MTIIILLLNTVHFFQRRPRTNGYTPPPGGRSITLQQTHMAFPPKPTHTQITKLVFKTFPCGCPFLTVPLGGSKEINTSPPTDRQMLPMDCSEFVNPYHDPNDLKKFFINREQLMIDEVELGSGNFGCVKKGVFKTNK